MHGEILAPDPVGEVTCLFRAGRRPFDGRLCCRWPGAEGVDQAASQPQRAVGCGLGVEWGIGGGHVRIVPECMLVVKITWHSKILISANSF